MANIFLIGATGRLGGHILQEALAQGHQVTALVRDPARLAVEHPHLRVVAGDVRELANVEAALPGHDVVVSALGTRRGQESYDVLSTGMENLIAGMMAAKIQRILVVASAGILQADAERLRRDVPGYPEVFRRSSAAHLAAYTALAESPLDWTIVGPPELVEGEADQALTVLENYLPDGPKRVSMPALARWMVGAIADPTTVRRRFGMNNA